jgi:hypothetical protein
VPDVFAAAIPANVAVPFALGVKVMPAGRLPVALSVGTGTPVAVTVKVKAVPAD